MWAQVGPQPIDTAEILSLAKDGLGLDSYDARMKFLRLMRQMDNVELNHLNAKLATK